MVLDPDGCFRALRARDARFDGVFFAGIKTTGIYCRPICPARPARRDRCLFFETAAAAERGGFRPCLRCRPEIAPGNARVDAVNRIATAALARIEAGALNERSVDALAAEFGVTSRHLRRAVESEFGVTPVEFAQTQRLLLAKQLLTETALPVTEVAYASGFASLRRFNALFQQRYRLSPTQLRGRRAAETSETVTCEIAYRPPYDWPSLLGFFAERACPGVEEVTGATYRRHIIAGKKRGWIEVTQSPQRHSLRVAIDSQLTPSLAVLMARVKRMFDVSAHPRRIEEHLREDERLRPLVDAHPGLRVPGAFDGFEMALRAVLGQQVSVKAARTIAGRFAAAFDGLGLAGRIAAASVEDLRKLGVTVGRAESILALARKTADGTLRLEPGADAARTMEQLKEIPGIGEWTAQYIAMRALGWPDALPHTDLGLYKALDTRSPREVLRRSARWSPWRSYALMHLWKSLEGK